MDSPKLVDDDTAMLDLHVDGWWQQIALRLGLWLIGLTEPKT